MNKTYIVRNTSGFLIETITDKQPSVGPVAWFRVVAETHQSELSGDLILVDVDEGKVLAISKYVKITKFDNEITVF